MKISVIICTHNPREEYLEKVLQALNNQTLDQEIWDLVIVDNKSKSPLTQRIDLSWHRSAKIIFE